MREEQLETPSLVGQNEMFRFSAVLVGKLCRDIRQDTGVSNGQIGYCVFVASSSNLCVTFLPVISAQHLKNH